MEPKICKFCLKSYLPKYKQSPAHWSSRKYCSTSCASKDRAKEYPKMKKMKKTLIKEVVLKLKNKHGSRCWYCGMEIYERISLDHVHPKSEGGSDDIGNFALACPRCNHAKYTDDVLSFLAWLSHIRSGNFECLILGKLSKEDIGKIDPRDWDRLRKDFWE
jgi:5-methylcytosine-specific restriction endonuclease McrA